MPEQTPAVAYSPAELEEFRTIILAKLADAQAGLTQFQQALTHADSNGTEDTYSATDLTESGNDVMGREELALMAERQHRFIEQLNNALSRIQNRTYGICRATGKLIPKERLRLVPHATLSLEAKLKS